MKELIKERIIRLVLGIVLLGLGVGEWTLAALTGYTITFAGERVLLNIAIFYLSHIGAIVLGSLGIVSAFRIKHALRFCPTCQKVTRQIQKGAKQYGLQWRCEGCRKANIQPPGASNYQCPKCETIPKQDDIEERSELEGVAAAGLYCKKCGSKLTESQ